MRNTRIHHVLTLGVMTAVLAACGGSSDSDDGAPPTPGKPVARAAGLVFGSPQVVGSSLSVDVLTQEGAHTLTTGALSADALESLKSKLAAGNLIDWIPGESISTAQVPEQALDTIQVILSKGNSANAQFSLQQYGAQVSRYEDQPGPMVAAGWVYGKGNNQITIGDGTIVLEDQAGRAYDPPIKRYEETYTVAADAQVFEVNTQNYASSKASNFAAIPVTRDYHYATTERQAAYVLFDKNYLHADDAKVVAIWYFTPQSTSDGKPVWEVPSQSPMLDDKGNDPVSGLPYVAINATGVTNAPYSRSTEPFVMVKDTLYYVGDNEVASYILVADMGTPNDPSDDKVIKIDGGWPNSGYQYWKNMELLGLDPRSVTDIWLTHGHTDHYGTIVEQIQMMDNAGLPVALWASKEELGISQDMQGNPWNIAGALPQSQTVIRERITDNYVYDQWYDYGNVQIMVIWSPGHTPGTTNMLFRVKNPDDGQFYTFGYHGGYGFNGLHSPTASNGWLRLSFEHGFSYLQQTLDVDYVAPQHTNQFPIVEVYQALKAYNRDPANAGQQLTMMDAMRSKVYDSPTVNGTQITSEFANQLEKRRAVAAYDFSDAADSRYKSIQTSGPFKPGRENGLTDVSAKLLDGGKIVQAFVGQQNKNPAIPLIANGIQTATDLYVSEIGGYYVQVAIEVQDQYQGFLPNGLTQFSPGMNASITYQGGPIESVHTSKSEYLRTQRLDTLEQAEQILATLVKDQTVTISLTPSSEIVVPENVAQTFR